MLELRVFMERRSVVVMWVLGVTWAREITDMVWMEGNGGSVCGHGCGGQDLKQMGEG